MKKDDKKKIQTKQMQQDIQRSRDITEAWQEGGKAIGRLLTKKPKKKKNYIK